MLGTTIASLKCFLDMFNAVCQDYVRAGLMSYAASLVGGGNEKTTTSGNHLVGQEGTLDSFEWFERFWKWNWLAEAGWTDHISKYFTEQINIYPLSFIACFILAESSATHISNYYFLEPEYEWCYKKEECAEETWKEQFAVRCCQLSIVVLYSDKICCRLVMVSTSPPSMLISP